MMGKRPLASLFVGWLGFCWVLFGGFLVFFSPSVVFPFLSMMTWAHRPHGVRTRGKTELLLLDYWVFSCNFLFLILRSLVYMHW